MSADLDKLDQAIDRAVREMLDVEPRADLRARVVRRIEAAAREGRSRSTPTLSWILVPFAAAALIVLAVFVARRSEPVPQAPVVAHAPDMHLPAAARPELPSAIETPVGQPPAAARDARAIGPAGARVAVATVADDASVRFAPLNSIAPIAVAPIEQDTIAPAEIAVRPLNTVAEIQIAPLTPPDRR